MNEETEVLRLPLWRECVRHMLADGVEHGKTYTASYFEKELRCENGTMQFALAVTEIRRSLEQEGYYLSGRGGNGEQWVIVPAELNCQVMLSYGRKAADALHRGVILGTNTHMSLLSDEDRRRHESILEKMAIKCALIQRSAQVVRALSPDAQQKLLKA